MNDVHVVNSACDTYYEVLGWNQGGEAGGYTGLQDSSTYGRSFIFSIWDPSNGQAIRPEYVSPGGAFVENFGGEGTGLKFFYPSTFGAPCDWNRWYTILTRAWPVGNHTFFGAWLYDSGPGTWKHMTTFDYPVAGAAFNYGAMAFLEDWTTLCYPAYRRVLYRFGRKRHANQTTWDAFTTGYWDTQLPMSACIHARGSTDGDNYVMERGGSTPWSGSTATLNVPSFGQPNPLPGELTQARAFYEPRSDEAVVTWVVDKVRYPQFGYRIELYDNPQYDPPILRAFAESKPQARSGRLSMAGLAPGKYYARVRITDLLDRTSSWQLCSLFKCATTKSLYLSDLQPVYEQNGYGQVKKDQSTGGNALTLDGTSYAKGLGCHASSEIGYNLDYEYQWFIANVGVDDEVGRDGTVRFEVLLDGTLAYDSDVMTGTATAQQIVLNVDGKQSLIIRVEDAGDGIYRDHADWADARLIKERVAFSGKIMPHAFAGNLSSVSLSFEVRYPGGVDTHTVSLDATGGYYFESPPRDGAVSQSVKGQVWLRKNLAITLDCSNQFGFALMSGDLDGNNLIDILDLNLCLVHFGEAQMLTNGDGNGDGQVNIHDLNLVLVHFGLQGDP